MGFSFVLYILNNYNMYNIPIQEFVCIKSINSPASACPGQGNWPRALLHMHAFFLLTLESHRLILQCDRKSCFSPEPQIVKWPLPTRCQWRQVPPVCICRSCHGDVRFAWYGSNEKCLTLTMRDWRSSQHRKLQGIFHFGNLGPLTTECILSCFSIACRSMLHFSVQIVKSGCFILCLFCLLPVCFLTVDCPWSLVFDLWI